LADQPESVDQLLSSARRQLARLSPAEALEAAKQGATLVDIRSDTQRAADGLIPDAAFVSRNVLECGSTRRPSTAIPTSHDAIAS
jgi:hypothetical protein